MALAEWDLRAFYFVSSKYVDLILLYVLGQKKNMCVYYLMKISNRVGRSIFFFILFLFFI